MKSSIAIFLLALFLISNSGMVINMHWCGGKLASIQFALTSKSKCKCGQKSMKANCCKDKTIVFKTKGEVTKTQQLVTKLSVPFIFIGTNLIAHGIIPTQNLSTIDAFFHPPPFKPKASIYLMDCIFLI